MGEREVAQVADDVITVDGIRKAFAVRGGETLAIENVSVGLSEGEFVSIVGPSGCGKTTLLRCVSGLLPIDRGAISYRGERVTGSCRRCRSSPRSTTAACSPGCRSRRTCGFH